MNRDRLRSLLDYDQNSGEFTWKVNRKGGVKKGDLAGGIDPSNGYARVTIDGRSYHAHRLAVFWMTGEWPPHDVDHKNGNRADNCWNNLRLATRSENNFNVGKPRNNTSGIKGVSWNANAKKWESRIGFQGRQRYLGLFSDLNEAKAAYDFAAEHLHGDFRPRLT